MINFIQKRGKVMSLKEERLSLIEKFGKSPKNTGSSEVQIALLTERIKKLMIHLGLHKKDLHTRRGLHLLISKRKKLLNFIKRKDFNQYKNLITSLNLRK